MVEGISTAKIVWFHASSMKLCMRENCIIVLPVNILIHGCGTPASWATRHTTVYLDVCVPSRTRILSHMHMGHPVRVWHFSCPIRAWATRTRIGPRTRMGHYNCILRRLAL